MIAAVGTRRRLAPISVLDADRDLAEGLDDQQFEEARRALVVPAIGLAKGDWDPRQAASSEDAHLGALVVEGILVREVAIGDSVCAEARRTRRSLATVGGRRHRPARPVRCSLARA